MEIQEKLLKLINSYESMGRKIIKQNVKKALTRRNIKLVDVCKDLNMAWNKVKHWTYMDSPNIPTLKDALRLAEFYYFSISELIAIPESESLSRSEQSQFLNIIIKYTSTDRSLIKKNLKLGLDKLGIKPRHIKQDLDISIHKVRLWVGFCHPEIPILKDALALCIFYNLNILNFCKNRE